MTFGVDGGLSHKSASTTLGFPVHQALVIGIVLSVCETVYVVPRTAVLGVLGITAYLRRDDRKHAR
jgi:hypothetical protein